MIINTYDFKDLVEQLNELLWLQTSNWNRALIADLELEQCDGTLLNSYLELEQGNEFLWLQDFTFWRQITDTWVAQRLK